MEGFRGVVPRSKDGFKTLIRSLKAGSLEATKVSCRGRGGNWHAGLNILKAQPLPGTIEIELK